MLLGNRPLPRHASHTTKGSQIRLVKRSIRFPPFLVNCHRMDDFSLTSFHVFLRVHGLQGKVPKETFKWSKTDVVPRTPTNDGSKSSTPSALGSLIRSKKWEHFTRF